VVVTVVMLASDEMVAEGIEFLPKLRGERKETGRGSEVSEPVDLSSHSVDLRVSAP
jgi:hypothetical protein